MRSINILRNFLTSGSVRTIAAKKNILFSFGSRGLSIISNLLLVPLTIHYVNPTQYGIWLTISSMIQWISFFDLGLAHGFRNRFAEAKASGDFALAKQYVSTTYAVLIMLFGSLFIIFCIINNFLDWSTILNISPSYKSELSKIVLVLILFLSIQLVANVFSTLLLADQKPGISSLILTFGQVGTLIIIFLLTRTVPGDLLTLALVSSAIPVFVTVIFSIYYFRGRYRQFAPSLKFVRLALVKNILGLGGKFFIIQLCMLFTLQSTNIILTRIEGPIAVAEYNIAYKYFSVLLMGFVIIFTPFWSAFTEAYVKRDFKWMKSAYDKLFWIAMMSIPLTFAMFLLAPVVYRMWIKEPNIKISTTLSLLMAIYIVLLTFGNFLMTLINGTGKIYLQTIMYLIFAIISIPLMILFCNLFSTPGVLIVPIMVFLFQNIFGFIQIKKILNNSSDGIWSK